MEMTQVRKLSKRGSERYSSLSATAKLAGVLGVSKILGNISTR